jgi:hypothetical protein
MEMKRGVPTTAKPQAPLRRPADPPSEYETREAAWAIVKDSKGMNETGHGAAVRWARAYLGLDDR